MYVQYIHICMCKIERLRLEIRYQMYVYRTCQPLDNLMPDPDIPITQWHSWAKCDRMSIYQVAETAMEWDVWCVCYADCVGSVCRRRITWWPPQWRGRVMSSQPRHDTTTTIPQVCNLAQLNRIIKSHLDGPTSRLHYSTIILLSLLSSSSRILLHAVAPSTMRCIYYINITPATCHRQIAESSRFSITRCPSWPRKQTSSRIARGARESQRLSLSAHSRRRAHPTTYNLQHPQSRTTPGDIYPYAPQWRLPWRGAAIRPGLGAAHSVQLVVECVPQNPASKYAECSNYNVSASAV